MNYETLLEHMKSCAATQKAMQNEIDSKLYSFIEQAVIAFLAENPLVDSIHWLQYTPYFNDGDACEFTIDGPCFTLKDDEISLGETSTIYTKADYAQALKYLEEAIKYELDPTAWIEAQAKQYESKYGRRYSLHNSYLRPIYSKEEAIRNINRISKFLEETTEESRNKIQTSFDNFVKLFYKFQDSSYRSAYGEHSYVIITREGTTIETYDHD